MSNNIHITNADIIINTLANAMLLHSINPYWILVLDRMVIRLQENRITVYAGDYEIISILMPAYWSKI